MTPLSSSAYSRASSLLWIEHGPTMTTSRSLTPASTSATSARAWEMHDFDRAERGISERRSAGESSGESDSMRRSSPCSEERYSAAEDMLGTSQADSRNFASGPDRESARVASERGTDRSGARTELDSIKSVYNFLAE